MVTDVEYFLKKDDDEVEILKLKEDEKEEERKQNKKIKEKEKNKVAGDSVKKDENDMERKTNGEENLPKILVVCDNSVDPVVFIKNLCGRLEGGRNETAKKNEETNCAENIKEKGSNYKNENKQNEKESKDKNGRNAIDDDVNKKKDAGKKKIDAFVYNNELGRYVLQSTWFLTLSFSDFLSTFFEKKYNSDLSSTSSSVSSSAFPFVSNSPLPSAMTINYFKIYKAETCVINTKYYKAKVAFWICKLETFTHNNIQLSYEKKKHN